MEFTELEQPNGGLVHLLSAPEGSLFWAAGMRLEILTCRRMREVDHEYIRHCVGLLLRSGAWRNLRDNRSAPFTTFTQFCCARPPHGLGFRRADLAAVLD